MKTYFPNTEKIQFEGESSRNPLAFRYYDENRIVAGKTMKEHLRYAVCYWHTFCGTGADPFGPGPQQLPWLNASNPMEQAHQKMDAAFEFFTKLGVPFYCFHDRDMAPEGNSVEESEANLWELVKRAKDKQAESGVKLLWGTANLFSHPRYMNGGATNSNFDVVCQGAAQVKAAIDATKFLGGENYVFWGGREGYDSLLNTNMKREKAHFAEFLRQCVNYAEETGFTGQFLIEPKPMEPTKHQYDVDSATVIGFLRENGLEKHFKINHEPNHGTLAGHDPAHDIQVAADAGMLGSIDANRGDAQNGWDTDQFPTNLNSAVDIMRIVLQQGGLAPGGLNFDAKTRRNSTDLEDIFYGHIGAMDNFARALVIADDVNNNSEIPKMLKQRYSSFDAGQGSAFEAGKLSLSDLRDLAATKGEPTQISGQQELYENIYNIHIG
ncbi:xylose isomerase [Lentisphaera profundi]|uniref:Xylose isomerase n=1 Tax=Lentisphaera profundi TaxID=1658616 RepID=A0ABY7VTB2_9BACT|nr:xylose isomerase [Lentisphaera profundi]WDE97460.1 xylose isomerase [Lentisphaera profundi]